MNTELFQQKIERLRQRPGANQEALDAIKQWVLSAEPFDRIRISPHTVVQHTGADIEPVVSEMLYSVPPGLFDLYWDMHCPHCNMVTQDCRNLSDITSEHYCPMCEMSFEGDFSELVEVVFSLNNEIEYVEMRAPCPPLPAMNAKFSMVLPYRQSASAEDTLEAGVYRYYCPITLARGILTVEGEPTDTLQVFKVVQQPDPHFDPPQIRARPGRLRFEVENSYHPLAGFFVIENELPRLRPEDLPLRLRGLDILHLPAFQELFSDQVLSSRERLRIAAVTTMFTDITGSTQMYERLGDAVAYNIVRDHFDILFQAIIAHGGTILKTIGDAVMASFTTNQQALRAILSAMQDFDQYNRERHMDQQVYIKIGIHRGPAILVNLNDALDYFGSTINKAARIQGQARSNEIAFSPEVYNDEAFMYVLREHGLTDISQQVVNLKGLQGNQTIYKVRVATSGALSNGTPAARPGLLAGLRKIFGG